MAYVLGKEIHVLDKLILTQMSPGFIPEQIVDTLHKIRKHFGLEGDCNCCRKADAYEIGEVKELTPDLDEKLMWEFSNLVLSVRHHLLA